jgi:hypothetical protein
LKEKKGTSSLRKKTKDMLVDNNSHWQEHHLKSLQTAYRSSPFYEFYEDDLLAIFNKKYTFLQDVNIDTYLFVTAALQISQEYSKTKEYDMNIDKKDYRDLADVKKQPKKSRDKYIQMFDNKHGYLDNLSILDLLFMEGPNAISYLE